MSEPTTSARRYNLTDLLRIIDGIGTTTAAEAHLTSTDVQALKRHTALCAILKQQEQSVEQATLSLITRSGPAPNLANQAIRPPVSRFARTMWGSGNGKDMVEVRDFAEANGAEDRDGKQRRFETERDRQLYYRPREWRRRRRGEWADTGPRSA